MEIILGILILQSISGLISIYNIDKLQKESKLLKEEIQNLINNK